MIGRFGARWSVRGPSSLILRLIGILSAFQAVIPCSRADTSYRRRAWCEPTTCRPSPTAGTSATRPPPTRRQLPRGFVALSTVSGKTESNGNFSNILAKKLLRQDALTASHPLKKTFPVSRLPLISHFMVNSNEARKLKAVKLLDRGNQVAHE